MKISIKYLPLYAQQAQVSSTIRMIEKYGVDGLLCNSCKKAKLELLYVLDIKGRKGHIPAKVNNTQQHQWVDTTLKPVTEIEFILSNNNRSNPNTDLRRLY